VTSQSVDAGLGSDIPDPAGGVSAGGQQHVYSWVNVNGLTG